MENLYLCISTKIIIGFLIDFLNCHFITENFQASISRYAKDLKLPNLTQNQFPIAIGLFNQVLNPKLIFYITI